METLAEEAKKNGFPIIGVQTGRLLQHYASIANARRIFEMGSGFGYSALWFVAGMAQTGRIICSDFSTENLQKAEKLFANLHLPQQVIPRCGNALEILELYDKFFDIVFIDIDKHWYSDAFDAAWPKVRKGGFLIADNIFWKGTVFASATGNESTEAIQLFTRRVFNQPDAESVILPVDDGVLVAMKK